MYDDTDPMMELEAELEELAGRRAAADREQAQIEAHGRAVARAEAAGRCCHGRAVSYRDPPVYPEQEGLAPGQLRCTAGCGSVFGSDAAWLAAIERAVYGR
jgi:hypothetical protein